MMNRRVEWLDILKLIGIVLIYFGHYHPGPIGHAYSFVYSHHVHLFFFAAGCSAYLSADRSFYDTVKKKAVTLLIPFYIFSALTLIQHCFVHGLSSYGEISPLIWDILLGSVRNGEVSYSLWFLTCMFSVSVLFSLLMRLKNKGVILLISLGAFLLSSLLLQPLKSPSWIYNSDSALYFLIFYAVGYMAFPHIKELIDYSRNSPVFTAAFWLVAFYIVMLYYGKSIFYLPVLNLLDILPSLIHPLIIILFWIFVAVYLSAFSVLSYMGTKTLLLCCNEQLVKHGIISIAAVLGFTLSPIDQITALAYSILLIWLSCRLIIPAEEKVLSFIQAPLIKHSK